MKRTLVALVLPVALAFAGTADASPLTWYLQDVTFTDAIATGFFDFDPSVGAFGTYSSASIDITKISSGESSHLSGGGSSASFHEVCFCDAAPATFLVFEFIPPLPAAGGTASLDPAFSVLVLSGDSQHLVSGSLTTTAPAGVPEPNPLLLLSTGVMAWVALNVTKKRRSA